jgi:hypothetical protein
VLNAYNYFTENQKFSYEFEELQKLIINTLNEVKRGEIFEYYIKAKGLIESAAQTKPVVNIDEFIEICKPANENIANIITDENGNETEYTAWKLMCVYFHETGVLLYYPESPTLKKKIFIRPTFVTDSIYKVLNYKVKQNFGRFTFDDAVKSLDNNEELSKDIIELMSAPNFKLIFEYPKESKNYIAPQYLPDRKKDEDFHAINNMKTGFILKFGQFLPKYILTEFMVEYGDYQEQDKIWKYGLLFSKHNCSAFVECKMDERKVIFKSFETGEHNRLKFEIFDFLRQKAKNDRNLEIALDEFQEPYNLQTVLKDERNEMFQFFRVGYKRYINGQQAILDGFIDEKILLDKELDMTYDSAKRFTLKKQIKELEMKIEELKKKI